MGKKAAKKASARKAARTEGVEREAECNGVERTSEEELPGRRDLLLEAIRQVRAAMKKETEPSRTSIGNLVQLLKLHKELMEEEETPTEIQLIWEETEEELFAES